MEQLDVKPRPAWVRDVESGVLPIHNNPVEHAIRPIATEKNVSINLLIVGVVRLGAYYSQMRPHGPRMNTVLR